MLFFSIGISPSRFIQITEVDNDAGTSFVTHLVPHHALHGLYIMPNDRSPGSGAPLVKIAYAGGFFIADTDTVTINGNSYPGDPNKFMDTFIDLITS